MPEPPGKFPIAHFPLAPMSGLIRAVTYILIGLPLVFFIASMFLRPIGAVGLFIAVLYLWIVLYLRPTGFELDDDALTVVWPLRRRRVPFAELGGAEVIGHLELRRRFGLLLRVGAGGLWGGFGYAWSSRGRHLDMYVSRHADGFVLVTNLAKRSLLITPARPRDFVAALELRRRR